MKPALFYSICSLVLLTPVLLANAKVVPLRPKQGDAVKVETTATVATVRMDSQTVPIFHQANGAYSTLLPIPVQAKPGEHQLEFLDDKGATLERQTIRIVDAHFRTQNVVLSKKLTELESSPAEREQMEAFAKTVSPERYWTEPFKPPVAGCVTSPFGVARLHNGKLTGDIHAGLDQRSPAGSPIRAVAAGVVKVVQQFELRGGTVAIDHGQGLESVYLHMSRFNVAPGQPVNRGDVIGYIGSTGRSTGPHLHWSLYDFGQPINPGQWMAVTPCRSPKQPVAKRHKPQA